VTFIPSAPASIIAMLNDPGAATLRSELRWRVVITGGASCPVETIRAYRQKMPGHLIELYGMLETGFHTFTRLTDDPEAVTERSDARGGHGPASHRRRRPRRAAGRRGRDRRGRPSPCTSAITRIPRPTRAVTADGWFRTGDLGQFAAAGNVKIVRAGSRR